MRRSLALVCIAVLLMTALALPVAWVDVELDASARLAGPALSGPLPGAPLDAKPPRLTTLSALLFRGPPAALGSRSHPGNSTREEAWHGRAGWRRSSPS